MTPRIEARADIALMSGYHSPQLDVKVRLNTNESPVPPPEEFTEAVAAAVRRIDWNRYPDRSAGELRDKIAGLHGDGVEPGNVFAANGSNEVIQCLLLAFGGPGRAAAAFEPTYALHSHLARVTGTAAVGGRRAADLSLDLDEAAAVIGRRRPEVTFLCSPNNPTGMADPPGAAAAVLEMAAAAGGLLCVDEAYGQFSPHTALGLAGPDVPLAVTRTYSKTWAMAGARLGYLIGPEWVVAELDKVALPYHLDAMTQAAGIAALDHVGEMNRRVADLVAERSRLSAGLERLPVKVWPSDANFVLFRPAPVPGAEVWRRLVDRSVLVRDCSSWPGLEGCLRVTVGAPGENDAFLQALEEILT